MKKLLTALPFMALILFSCQKEVNFDDITNPGNGGGTAPGTTGDLLVKIVAVTGTETITTLYSYDGQKRLETSVMDGSSGGMKIHNYTKYLRDASGRITRILQKVDQDGMSSDTAVNLIHYPDATTMEYDYSVNNISMMGFSTLDSAVYKYASGKMLSAVHYLSSPLFGAPIQSSSYTFTYDGSGRVTVLDIAATLSPTGGSLSPIAKETFTYGNSVNYMWASNSAAQNFLLGGMPNKVNNDVTKMQMDDLTDPSNSLTITSSFVAGANGKPATGKVTSVSLNQGTQVTNYTFFYQ